MKVLATLAFLCFLQAFASQVVDDQKHDNQVNKPDNQPQHHNSGQQVHAINSHQHVNKEQHVAASNPQNVEQHVAKPEEIAIKVPQAPVEAKVTVQIPAKVQQIVTQVSQHIPQVVEHHQANKQRVVRSVKTHLDWQEMQVNAVAQPGKCEFICNQVDATVCGYNGRCYWEFGSQCDLSTYNCLNTQQIFHIVDFAKCQDIGAAKCYRGDF